MIIRPPGEVVFDGQTGFDLDYEPDMVMLNEQVVLPMLYRYYKSKKILRWQGCKEWELKAGDVLEAYPKLPKIEGICPFCGALAKDQ